MNFILKIHKSNCAKCVNQNLILTERKTEFTNYYEYYWIISGKSCDEVIKLNEISKENSVWGNL